MQAWTKGQWIQLLTLLQTTHRFQGEGLLTSFSHFLLIMGSVKQSKKINNLFYHKMCSARQNMKHSQSSQKNPNPKTPYNRNSVKFGLRKKLPFFCQVDFLAAGVPNSLFAQPQVTRKIQPEVDTHFKPHFSSTIVLMRKFLSGIYQQHYLKYRPAWWSPFQLHSHHRTTSQLGWLAAQ